MGHQKMEVIRVYIRSDAVDKKNPEKQNRHACCAFKTEVICLKLWKYDGKTVKITNIDGQTFFGTADCHSADKNASGIQSLTIETFYSSDGMLIDFEEQNIASIELISAATQNLAVAV